MCLILRLRYLIYVCMKVHVCQDGLLVYNTATRNFVGLRRFSTDDGVFLALIQLLIWIFDQLGVTEIGSLVLYLLISDNMPGPSGCGSDSCLRVSRGLAVNIRFILCCVKSRARDRLFIMDHLSSFILLILELLMWLHCICSLKNILIIIYYNLFTN